MTEQQYAEQLRDCKMTYEELVVLCAALLKHEAEMRAELDKLQGIIR